MRFDSNPLEVNAGLQPRLHERLLINSRGRQLIQRRNGIVQKCCRVARSEPSAWHSLNRFKRRSNAFARYNMRDSTIFRRHVVSRLHRIESIKETDESRRGPV
jgi:hypothetical protein